MNTALQSGLTLWSIAAILYTVAWTHDNRFLESLAITTILFGLILMTGMVIAL